MSGKRGVVTAAVLVGTMLGAAACGPKKNPTMGPSVAQQQQQDGDGDQSQSVEDRFAHVTQANEAFAAARKELAGHSDEQSRGNLATALGKLQNVLTSLKGPQRGGAFRQQMHIIESAQTRLTGDSATAPEPTVNAAIRAAYNALSTIASDQFTDEAQLKTLLDAVQTRMDSLNTVRGPIHGFEAARALDDIGAVTQRMADLMQQRLPKAQTTTAPAAAAQ